jgi:DnaJ like chaperone protein
LAEVAKADGTMTKVEQDALRQIASALGLNPGVVDQLFAMGGNSLEDDYKVLGISPDATDEEVRQAYRKMVIQYHPDKVATLGDDVKEAATRKIQEINEAKERIYRARNMR